MMRPSEIPYAEFFHYETTAACMKVLREIIARKGIPRALYVDKAGWSGGGKRTEFSQFQRACGELGIQVLFANSPQAKGRIERSFNTVQDRIIPELRINKIKSMAKANYYLRNVFLTKYWNQRNIVKPESTISEYRSAPSSAALDEILCFKRHRGVAPNNCISYRGDIIQLKHPDKRSLAKKRVELREYDCGSISIFFDGVALKHTIVQRYNKPEQTWEEHIVKLEARLGIPKSRRYNGTKSLGN